MYFHFREEIEELTMKDLQYLSDFLGQKKFILGNEPSEYDCAVFGHLAQVMWGLPDSKFEKALKGIEKMKFRKFKFRCKLCCI